MVLIAFCRRVWCALNAAPRLTLNPPSLVYSFLFFVLSFPSNRADQSSILKRSAAKSRIPSTCRWVYLYSFLFSVSLSLQRDQHVAYVGNNNICIYFVVLIFFFALYIYLYIYIYIYIYIYYRSYDPNSPICPSLAKSMENASTEYSAVFCCVCIYYKPIL
jgi:hypothetical protein